MARMKGGEIAQWKRLDRVWALVGDKPGYASYLRDEISQMVGVTAKQSDFDPEKLPAPIRARLRQLDEIIGKILSSDLNDIPESLRNKAVQCSEPYDFEGC